MRFALVYYAANLSIELCTRAGVTKVYKHNSKVHCLVFISKR